MSSEKRASSKQYALNLTLAAVVSQVGCLTTALIVVALLLGLWLDARLGTKPMFTLILLVGSAPITLALMFWIVRRATAHIQPQPPAISAKEANRGGHDDSP